MKKVIIFSIMSVAAFIMILSSDVTSKDYTGCYICRGQSGTYVRWRGSDDYSKRKKAKSLGCEVGGTTSSCDAANHKILGTVN